MQGTEAQPVLARERVVRQPIALLQLRHRFVPQVSRVPARMDELEFDDEMQRQALVERILECWSEANFEVGLTPTLEDALNKGLPLHFVVEFALIHPRWYTAYLWNKSVAELQQRYRDRKSVV